MEQEAHAPGRGLFQALRNRQIVQRPVSAQVLVGQKRRAAVVGARQVQKPDRVLPFDMTVRQPFGIGQGKTGHGHPRSLGKAPAPRNSRLPLCRGRIIAGPMGDQTDQARLSAAREANKAGMAALRTGDSQAAVAAFRQAIELDPEAGALWRSGWNPPVRVAGRGAM